MAILKKETKQNLESKGEWKTLFVPMNKLRYIGISKTGASYMIFEVGVTDSNLEGFTFIVSTKCVRVGADETFNISLPNEPLTISKSVVLADGNKDVTELQCESPLDLGYIELKR